MPNYPALTNEFRISRLADPKPISDIVLDTDTYNEVDDQFALAYCLLSPEKVNLKAVYAAPFHNNRSNGPEDGMLKSLDEIKRVISKIKEVPPNFVFEGSRKWLKDSDGPVDSPAARDLVAKAMAQPDDKPLYVLTIGAPTNVASAILMQPEIIRKIVIVWLGGQPLTWHTAREFNLFQDIAASRVLFDSGVPLAQVPCTNVAEHLRVSLPFLNEYLAGNSPLGDYLNNIVQHYTNDPFCWSKVIWDISTVAWMVNPRWFASELLPSPILNDNFTYARDGRRHLIRVFDRLDRDGIFRDLFTRINNSN